MNAKFFKLSRHPLRPLDASGANGRQTGIERRIAFIEGEPENVNLQRFPLNGNFNAVNKGHSGLIGCSACRNKAAKIIVIGQRKHLDTVCGRPTGDFGRRQRTVGGSGMAVKIGVEHGGKKA
jgi:hypothetical protein